MRLTWLIGTALLVGGCDGRDEAALPTSRIEPKPDTSVLIIPGLVVRDAYSDLERRGFTRTEMQPGDPGSPMLTKTIYDPRQTVIANVTVSGSSGEANFVHAAILHKGQTYPHDIAKEFFQRVVSANYDGAEPELARAWIAQNLGFDSDRTIGGARMVLRDTASGPILVILPASLPQPESAHLLSILTQQ